MKYYRVDDKKVNKVYRKYIKGSLIFLMCLREYYGYVLL